MNVNIWALWQRIFRLYRTFKDLKAYQTLMIVMTKKQMTCRTILVRITHKIKWKPDVHLKSCFALTSFSSLFHEFTSKVEIILHSLYTFNRWRNFFRCLHLTLSETQSALYVTGNLLLFQHHMCFLPFTYDLWKKRSSLIKLNERFLWDFTLQTALHQTINWKSD